jgi:hypothetical protein
MRMIQITKSQTVYEVRDASEIAFGLLILGVVLAIPAFFAGMFVASLVNLVFDTQAFMGLGTLLCWLGMMSFVVRRYLAVARKWPEQRRGSATIHLVEWMAAGLSLLLMFVPENGLEQLVYGVRIFFASLVLLLVFSHIATYSLLKYLPKPRDVIVWLIALGVSGFEIYRHGIKG